MCVGRDIIERSGRLPEHAAAQLITYAGIALLLCSSFCVYIRLYTRLNKISHSFEKIKTNMRLKNNVQETIEDCEQKTDLLE
jgi:hypothetical protein